MLTVETILQLDHLTKHFPTFTLEDVSLTLPGGVILGLIGENGAGKTTLIKCLLGLLRPTAGKISLLGKTVPEALPEVGYVPDECPFNGILKVGQVASILAGVYPTWDGALFDHYLEKFRLDRAQSVKELSRGMGMKLTIAAALAHRPRLLVLDEATSGLDPVVRDEILDEFQDFVTDDDHGVLLSSHITSDLEKLCDYVGYLHQGKLAVFGQKDVLLEEYAKVSCSKAVLDTLEPGLLAGVRVGQYGCQALVAHRREFARKHPELPLDRATLEDIMIFTAKEDL